MKKLLTAWLLILAVLLTATACKSQEEDIPTGGDSEIHKTEKLENSDETEEPETETPNTETPTETETPTTEEPKQEENKGDTTTEEPKKEESKDSSATDDKTPSKDETSTGDNATETTNSVSYYATYQKVDQLQVPDGLESVALTYKRNQYALIRVTSVDELQSFQSIADPYFQFTGAMEQGDQTGDTGDSDNDGVPDEDDGGVVEDTDVPETTGTAFVEGLTGNVYGSDFFQDRMLIFIYRVAPGKTNNGNVTAVKLDGNQLNICLDTTAQTNQTSDNVYRFISLEFKKSDLQSCEVFNLVEETK